MTETLIGSDEFGLTTEIIDGVKSDLQKDIELAESLPRNINLSDMERKMQEMSLARTKRQLAVLSATPDDVLEKLRYFYDTVSTLENSGMTPEEVKENVRDLNINIIDYYPVLRETGWGYRVGQRIGLFSGL